MILNVKKIGFVCCALALSSVVNAQEKKDSISTKEIQEVLIKGRKKKQFVDHANYTFDKEALEKARYAKDLLTTLPELQLDPISNTVTSIKGGRVLFLINGIEASDNQIKSVAPNNVVRVEYFDIPPARYAQRADTVVNIITRNPEVGYSYGADVTSALTTGFVNGSAYAGYTKGKNDFGFEYSINMRNYNNRIVDKTYEYQLNSIHYRSAEQQKDHFGYTNQNIALRYANVVPDKYTFQSKLSFFINSNFVDGKGNSVFTQDASQEIHSTAHNSNSNYTAPTLDLYYSRNLGKKDELSLNLIGSYYNTKSTQFDHEWVTETGSDVFNNDMNLRAKQTGIVGEIAHVHNFQKGKLSSGYRITNTNISNDLVNLLGTSHYLVNYLEQYLYTEYSGKKDKFSYRLGIGVTNIHNRSAETVSDDWAPTPKMVLGYDLAKNQSLRFRTDYTTMNPPASALSSNVIQVVPNILQYGNPLLKPFHLLYNSLNYSINNKFFDFNISVFHNYMPKSFSQFYVKTDNGYGLTFLNTQYVKNFGSQITGSIKPFGTNLLVVKIFIMPISIKVKKDDNTVMQSNCIRNNFIISSSFNDFTLQYQFNFPTYMLNGAFMSTDENQNNISATYKLKNWTFSSGLYWIGKPSEYFTKSLSGSLVDYTRQSHIYNNKNMFVLGLGYNFSSGKKLQVQKKLNNNTAPATTF